jgi:hypothetical protein
MPLAVLSLWWAAATRRTALLLSSASFATLAAGTADAARPGLWLAVAALIAVLLRLAADAGRRLPAPVRRLWWLLPAAAGWAALEPALRGEVFYTVLALLGVAAALRPPRTPVPHPSGNS